MPPALAAARRAVVRSVPAAAVAAVLGALLSPVAAAPASAAGPQAAAASSRPVGIDVSRYQSSSTLTSCSGPVQVDWRRVRAAGRSFAFVKATGSRTTGTISQDPCFDRNWAGAAAAGLFRGAYHYAVPSRRSGSAAADARFFVAATGRMQDPGDLPPVLDLEATGGLTRAEVQAWASSWLATVASLTGRQPILYTGPSFWRGSVAGGSTFAGHPLWIAHYTRSAPTVPSPWRTWTFWQSSAGGRVAGVSGPVDVDTFNGTSAQLSALAHPATVPSATASSTVVYGGQPWSLTGVLRSAGGTPVRAATVTLYRRLAGSTAWTAVSSVRTDARTAAYRFDLRPTTAASYRVRYSGGRDFAASWSPLRSHAFAERVPTTLSSTVSATRVTKRAGVAVTGTLTLTPTRAGLTRTPVVLYRKVGAGPWTKWRSLTTATGGRYRTTLHPVRTASYKVLFGGSASGLPATSPVRTVAVR
jgi:GH25 family lysozyme M1 (1,4-beta-N-acetylmuramidase)/5-hydroxyisourate hydrolase-like protein (transthyretin family)